MGIGLTKEYAAFDVSNAQSISLSTTKSVAESARGRYRWETREGWNDIIQAPDAPEWFNLENEPRAECVKIGHRRKTWRVRVGERIVYAKVFDPPSGAMAWIKRVLKGSPAVDEWCILRDAESRGIPVAQAVGVASDVESGRTILLTEEIANATPLAEWGENAPNTGSSEVRSKAYAQAIAAVAGLFAKTHEAGFFHRDNHPNNILMRTRGDGSLEAVLIDVHGAYLLNRSIPDVAARRSLAQLDQFFRVSCTRTERLRFLQQYLARRSSSLPDHDSVNVLRDWSRRIENQRRAHARRLAKQRNRRLHGDGKYFAKLEFANGWRGITVLKLARRRMFPASGYADRTKEQWIELLSPTVRMFEEALAKGSLTAQESNEIRAQFAREGMKCEFGWPESLWWRAVFRLLGSPVRNSFLLCHRRRHRDNHEELYLAYMEQRRFGLPGCTFIVKPMDEDRAHGRAMAAEKPNSGARKPKTDRLPARR